MVLVDEGWPAPGSSSTFVAEFLSGIEARATDAATPPEEQGRLRRFRDVAQDVGQGLLTDIAARVIEHQPRTEASDDNNANCGLLLV